MLQGTERSQVPPEVVEAVREEFKRQRVQDKRKITKLAVRRHLKRIKKTRYYDHCAQIARELSGDTGGGDTARRAEEDQGVVQADRAGIRGSVP